MPLIPCPACHNQCSPLASVCPQCGHPFVNTQDLKTVKNKTYEPLNISNEADNSNKWKVLTIIAGVIAGGLITFAVYSLYQKTPSKNTDTAEINAVNTANTNQPITPTPVPIGTLELEAAIIYNIGGVQPVARQKFYLLDKSLASILKDLGEKGKDDNDLITTFGLFAKFNGIEKQMAEVRKHIKYEVMTDFQGKAKFENIECKKYFLFGITPTRRSSSVWNMPVEIRQGKNSIVLDQNNAVYSL